MRVITGSARGRRLATREGEAVRPTSQRVKEGMFSAIQFDIEGRRVLDLFAGSGQLGIEALSRGAACCTFVDKSTESVNIINKNIETCGLGALSTVHRSEYDHFLRVSGEVYDIAFLDPPFGKDILEKAILLTAGCMSEAGVIICEHDINDRLPESAEDFRIVKNYKYAKTAVTLYRRIVAPPTKH